MTESNNKNTGIVPVDVGRLSGGLQTMFNGMSEVFGSIGAGEEAVNMIRNVKKVEVEASSPVPERKKGASEAPASSGNQKSEEPQATESSKKASSSKLTLADLQKAASTKIMADRKNQEKIQKIITSFGVTCLSDLPESRYEAFMTQLTTL